MSKTVVSRHGNYSIFLLGLAPVYLSNQHPLSLVLLVLSFLVPTVGQARRCHCSLVLSFHEQPPSYVGVCIFTPNLTTVILPRNV